MECREATQQLAAYVDYPSGPLDVTNVRALEGHLLSCASCRTELIRYQELSENLAALASKTAEPPAWLTAVLLDSVRQRSRQRAHLPQEFTAPRVAAAGGALLLAGLAAGALVVGRGRRKRRAPALRVAAA